jgi:sigma-B regulation protein RsbU (phosphoserine phosphatase)
MAEIEVRTSSGPRGRVQLSGSRLVIGRSEDSDVFLPDSRLSRRHAEIEQRGEGCFVIDLGSTNGTFLNGVRVQGESRLHNGDTITVGESRLIFSESVAEESGGSVVLAGAQAFTIRDLQARTTSRTVDKLDLQRQTRLLHSLTLATSSLLGHRPLPELFERVLDVIFKAVPAERVAIVLLDNRTGVPEIRAARSRDDEPLTRISRAISRRVLEQRVALLIPSVFDDLILRERKSVAAVGIRSAMCAPLWLAPRRDAPEEVIGLIYADTTDGTRAFDESDLEILTVFANVAASKIESTRLLKQNVERERLEREMHAAAEILKGIMPGEAPVVPGCELTGESRSCEAVGGDYHDYQWDGRELLLALADVSGKGLGAAMLMTALRSAVHAHWKEPSLSTAAARINRTFFGNVPSDRYATCFLGRFDPNAGRLAFVNAGHPPALVVRADGSVVRLTQGGPGLGLFADAEFEYAEVTLGAGDTLLIYSDGISESWPSEQEAESYLAELAVSYGSIPVSALRGQVLTTVDVRRGGKRSDDCTMIVLRWTPPLPKAKGQFVAGPELPPLIVK